MTTRDLQPADLHEIFVGDGEMARLMRTHEWASTPLGPPQAWPNALKVALRILLTSRFEMWLGWGSDVHFFYNDAYRPTLGLKHPRALGAPTRQLWSEIWEQIQGRIDTVYQQGQATWDRALMLLLDRSGYLEETYHTFSYSPLLGDSGRVEGLFCAVSEDTDRVISERRLAALRELAAGLANAHDRQEVVQATRHALDHASKDLPFSIVYLLDADGLARKVAAIGMPENHVLAPAALSMEHVHLWNMQRLLDKPEPYLVALDGHADLPMGPWQRPPRTALVVPIADQGSGRPAGMVIAALNPHRPVAADFIGFVTLLVGQIGASLASALVHERRQAERDRLRLLFDEAPSFFALLTGPDHVFEFANAAYRRLVGGRDVLGRTLAEALPEVKAQGFIDLLDHVYRTGERHVGRSVKVELAQAAGATPAAHFVDFVFQPMRDTQGAVAGIFVEGYEVTDKVEAEHALLALNAELEQRVERRTSDLAAALSRLQQESDEREAAQEALRQAQKMEAVGQLTGGIAHDFNNLLQGITGSLDLMGLQVQRGRFQDLAPTIARAMNSARRAAGLTHRLLAFSRRQPLDPKPLKVNQLIAPMEELLARTVGERIRVEMVTAAGLWTILCDANQLESAILNLCINARDAMPDGGLLRIETANVHLDEAYVRQSDVRPGQYVCISISDTGVGMTADVLAKAFDPFFTTKPIGQGTGLGLSMVYGFVKQSMGHLKLYSEPEKGTTAKIYLPRHFGEAGPPEPTAMLRSDGGTGVGQVILVVEDEELVRSLVVEALHGQGYRTIEASDGGKALALLASEVHVDLLVTDVGLPVINGRQLYDAAATHRPGLKVLFMTGYAENAALSGGVLEPGMELITKPFPLDRMVSTVERMLR